MSGKMAQPEGPGRFAGEVRTTPATDGVILEYETVGEGPSVVLLHGGFVGRRAFWRQRSVLAERFRLLLISSRGHDGTDGALPVTFGFASSEVEDVCAILNAEGVDRTHLIGHSTGGATAFAFARRYPERVERMALIEPTLLALLPPEEHQRVGDELMGVISAGESGGNMAAMRAILDFIGGDSWLALDEATKAARLEALVPVSPLVVPHAKGLLDLTVTKEDVRNLQSPTLLFYGDTSFFFEPAISQRLEAIRPDFPQVLVKDSGHNVHRDAPDLVNAEIIRFLGAP